jgi:hypothetical protein
MLATYATNGVLPFAAFVQVREDGRWTPVAKGSSVSWLDDAAREEAAMSGAARIVSQFGTVLARYGR